MSRWERYEGSRDRTFSRWHRKLPNRCTAIDLDFMEYCDKCKMPLALIELAQDVGQKNKPTTILKQLARVSGVPAFLIFYKIEEENEEIGDCRVQQIWPRFTPIYETTKEGVENWIISIHDEHECEGV